MSLPGDTVSIDALWSYTTEDVQNEITIDPVDVQNMTVDDNTCAPFYANLEATTFHQHVGNSPDSGYGDSSPSSNVPTLIVEEQPETSYRFRYKRETGKKPNGPLKGEWSVGKTPKNSSGPKVKLHNFTGEAIIRVWLYLGTLAGGPSPHCLLLTKNKVQISDEPHDFVVNATNNYTASFDKLNIVHVVMDNPEYQKLYLRKKAGLAKRLGDELVKDIPHDVPQNYNQKNVKKEMKEKSERGQLDICALYFEAFEKRGSEYYYIANAISREIKNKKSPRTNGLKIVRTSHTEGSALGGETVMIFTDKLVPDIRIVFTDGNWEADAKFEKKDIHKLVAVAFQTPPYKNVDITQPVTVQFRIVRTTDNAKSEPVMFRYLPTANGTLWNPPERKRKKAQTNEVSYAQQEVSTTYVDVDETSHEPISDPMLSEACDLEDLDLLEMEGSPAPSDLFDSDDQEWLLQQALDPMVRDYLPDPRRYLDVDNLGHDQHAYPNRARDSTLQAQGPRVLRGGSTPMSLVDRARLLHCSILRNDLEDFAKYLSGETVNFKIASRTPLHLAVELERTEMVNKLLVAKADPYALDGLRSNTPVHVAVMSSLSALQILMSSSILPSAIFNKDGDDAVIFAIRNSKIDAVKLLLKRGFSLESSNVKDGDSPLHVALQIKDEKIRYDMVCLLLEHEASVSRRNGAGLTALDVANPTPQPGDLLEKLSFRLSEESGDEDSGDEGDAEDLSRNLDSLRLSQTDDEPNLGNASDGTDASGSAAAVTGNGVVTSIRYLATLPLDLMRRYMQP